jgi:hypothetical protein
MRRLDTAVELLSRANDFRHLALNCKARDPQLVEELQNIAAEYIALAYEAKTASGRDKP